MQVEELERKAKEEERERTPKDDAATPESEQVAAWLDDAARTPKYHAAFVDQELAWDDLAHITASALASFGVTAFGPQARILDAIQRRQQDMAKQQTPHSVPHRGATSASPWL